MSDAIRRITKGQAIIVILPNVLYFVILIIAILLTLFFPQIPWQLRSGFSLLDPLRFLQLLLGTILLILALMFIVWGVTSLGRSRAQGAEIGSSRRSSALITNGAYAYCRHPQTLGFILATPAFALMFDFVPLLIVALLFTPLQLALLGYEEVELLRRFGDPYGIYRETVPFIIPRGKRVLPTS
ncbi:MAG: methyltransferase family protein [Candidatus Thorarchaeota archaeon]